MFLYVFVVFPQALPTFNTEFLHLSRSPGHGLRCCDSLCGRWAFVEPNLATETCTSVAFETNDATDANHQFKQTLIVCTRSYGPFKVKTSSEKDQLDFFNESCRGHPVG